ncbi:211_t:CDS:2, partial [Entrophospora sp. SA101]
EFAPKDYHQEKVLDEELRHETLASIEGSHLRNPSMPNKEEEIR